MSRLDHVEILRGGDPTGSGGSVYAITGYRDHVRAEDTGHGLLLEDGRRYLLIGVHAGPGSGELQSNEVGRTIAPFLACSLDPPIASGG